MKRIIVMSALAMAVLVLVSCKEKKSNTIIITKKKTEQVVAPKTRKMGDYTQSRSVNWMGKKYTVVTNLVADPTLPLASDGFARYYDNRITLRVIRADGTEFLKREFTKSFFKEYVDNTYYKEGALLGIVYVKTSGNQLLFAASVGNPDKSSDEYVPLVLKVDNFGNVTVSKDTRLDTDSDTNEEEDEGV
ncbi:MAG: DUF4738 domain-containing protein [Prevotella sp.]|nr:DUF4738 domain-containing protein [Prevotella sp.]